ncbi:PTH2-domain-containing protein [Glomus cerebriforme]|uniref:peptidyl-tRNA hydrolase n=1 Tax=Glomus cerebriforme TaxID=658196 RepID=A0A397S453_9GLOM|nr:PTH2-domain-containing protein [Glomus cerebriforme]
MVNEYYTLLAVASVSLLIGLFLGKIQGNSSYNDFVDSSDDETLSLIPGQINPDHFDEFKLVLLIRSDLGMTKGKVAAQCSHATLACYKILQKTNPQLLRAWEISGQPKITLKVKDYDELLSLKEKARESGLCARIIQDAGHTQVVPGSATVLGIGPGPVAIIDNVTGHLKLY